VGALYSAFKREGKAKNSAAPQKDSCSLAAIKVSYFTVGVRKPWCSYGEWGKGKEILEHQVVLTIDYDYLR
jgi:hypothetical protein